MKLTADVCDGNEDEIDNGSVQVLAIPLNMYGRRKHILGQVVTVKAFEDNSFVRKTLEEDGENRVLVVDGGGSRRCALMGGNLAVLAKKNGWQGAIIFGCVRDSVELMDTDIGIWAVGTSPVKSKKANVGSINKPIKIENCSIKPGLFCVADSDGVIFLKQAP
ncbi:ribonuclease E activity regulator RraA [Betaproteobacteria bacterium]|nr:ribonuclease E activity regulator RraA [Betaproteobacteria bacterium]